MRTAISVSLCFLFASFATACRADGVYDLVDAERRVRLSVAGDYPKLIKQQVARVTKEVESWKLDKWQQAYLVQALATHGRLMSHVAGDYESYIKRGKAPGSNIVSSRREILSKGLKLLTPPWLHPARDLNIGVAGIFLKGSKARVSQILGPKEYLGLPRRGRDRREKPVLFRGFATAGFVDGVDVKLDGQYVKVTGKFTYTSVRGARTTVALVEPFDPTAVKKHIAKVLVALHRVNGKAAEFESPLRTWKDTTGAFETKARFADYRDGKVRLMKPNGKSLYVPPSKLSLKDREFFRQEMKRRRDLRSQQKKTSSELKKLEKLLRGDLPG